MPRFLAQVPHGDAFSDCAQAVDAFLRTGSHFLAHAKVLQLNTFTRAEPDDLLRRHQA